MTSSFESSVFLRIQFFLSTLKKYKNSLFFLGTWRFRFTGVFSEESGACKGTCWKGEEPVEQDKKGSSRYFIAVAPFLGGKFHGHRISYTKLIRNIFQSNIKIESVQPRYYTWMTASAKSADLVAVFDLLKNDVRYLPFLTFRRQDFILRKSEESGYGCVVWYVSLGRSWSGSGASDLGHAISPRTDDRPVDGMVRKMDCDGIQGWLYGLYSTGNIFRRNRISSVRHKWGIWTRPYRNMILVGCLVDWLIWLQARSIDGLIDWLIDCILIVLIDSYYILLFTTFLRNLRCILLWTNKVMFVIIRRKRGCGRLAGAKTGPNEEFGAGSQTCPHKRADESADSHQDHLAGIARVRESKQICVFLSTCWGRFFLSVSP